MKKSMCITYEVENGLYINITNRCSNRCDFCIRNNDDGAYGSDSLWLEREPSLDEILESVFSRDIFGYSEIVFCGYGEPTYRLDDAVIVANKIREKHPCIPIRINTNGHSSLINNRDTSRDFEAFDTVSISLNAPNCKKYNEICHSKFGDITFEAIIDFAKNVKNCSQNVVFSVVRDFLSFDDIYECKRISKDLDIPLRIRDYISK